MQRTYSRKGTRRNAHNVTASPERDPDPPKPRKKRKIQIEVVTESPGSSKGSLQAAERPISAKDDGESQKYMFSAKLVARGGPT